MRFFLLGTLPLSSLHDALSLFAFAIVLVYFIIELGIGNKSSGFFILTFSLIVKLAALISDANPGETSELLSDPAFALHATVTLVGYTALALSAIYALLYILQHHAMKKHRFHTLSEQLPALPYLERMSIRSVVLGIVFMTFGIILGHMHANKLFGSFWISDPKVILTDLVVLAYLFSYILSRFFHWRGRVMAIFSLAGFFALMLVGFLVVTLSNSFHRFM